MADGTIEGLAGRRFLIFDLDGTLIDSSKGVIESTNYALRSLGDNERRPEEIKRYIGYPLNVMFHAFSDGDFSRFRDLFRERAAEVMARLTVPIDGASRVLEELLSRDYLLAVATTKLSTQVARIFARLGWHRYFRIYVGADNVAEVKPAPEAFERVMAEAGSGKNETIVIGDTVNDILAARAAGVPSVAVRSIFGREEELKASRPDIFIDRLDEILEILK
jgi:phosphoglycolate phosphatase